ncbi:alpha-L-rhamnosidase C-terminal domain-containing protein [Kiritimatiella glycovorans]|uniref:alpha-L-rhamnosidase C-terminal domain-containing protein n=1 Tax=Kiritimatiella glycovorans TaxID=1307763 RepID=UPI00069AC91F|nr:alpha-L-rhamnosidase C-terminal domain-containing protein [Kiritimatiella glycovorans]
MKVVPSPKGVVPVRWERRGGRLHLTVTVPPESRAILCWPGGAEQELEASDYELMEPEGSEEA